MILYQDGGPASALADEAEVQREEVRQLNVAIPVDLHREMRMRAVQEDITLRELCLQAFEAYLH